MRISGLGWLVASSAFAVSMGGTFLFAGQRMAGGHSLAGLTLIGLPAKLVALAAVPALTRRGHPELTDLLAAFSLATAATATGLLAGGPALVCAWAAESALLVGVAERMARRSGARRMRVTAAAGIYLGLAVVRALAIVIPTDGRLPGIGQGSDGGTIALTAVAVAGIAFCYGTRWIARREQVIVWALPALAIGYLPLWALPAEWAVVAEAGLAAAVFVYRRTPFTVAWLRDEAAIVIGGGFWATGAVLALAVTAPLEGFGDGGWDALGSRDGLSGLCALVAAAVVLTWSVRRPAREGSEFALLLPSVALAYLIAEALAAPYAEGLGAGTAGLGLLMCALPVGTIAGELFAGSRLRPATRNRLTLPLVCVTLLPYAAYALRPGLGWSLVLLVLAGAGSAYTLGLDQWFVRAVPDELLGRAMTLNAAGLMTVQGVGMALSGAVAEFAGVRATIVGAGVVGTAACVTLATAARRAERGPTRAGAADRGDGNE